MKTKLDKLVLYMDSDNNITLEKFVSTKEYPDNMCQFDECLSFAITDLGVSKGDIIDYVNKTR